MNRNLGLLATVPGPFPDQQRHLHRHQRSGRAGAGAAGLDGHPAGHGLCGRRRPFDRRGGADPAAFRPQGIVPGRPGRRAAVGADVRLCRHQPQLLAAVLRPRWWPATTTPTPTCTASPRPSWPAHAAPEKAVSWVMAGGLLGAVVGPNLAARSRARACDSVRRRLSGAGGRGAAGADRAVVHQVPGRRPAEGRRQRRTAAGADHAAARLHRGRGSRRSGLWRDEPADGRHADRDAAVRAAVCRCRAGAAMARDRHVRARVLHRQPDQAFRHAAHHGRGRGAEPGVHRRGPVRRRVAPVPGGAVPARRGLEFPVHRQHHAVAAAPTRPRRGTGPRAP